jgi:ABC-2 type transport system permease protein
VTRAVSAPGRGSLRRAVSAYPTLLRVGFAEAVAYRAEMLVWMLTTTMPLVSLALWSAVAEEAPVGRFTQRGLSAYFLATLVVRQVTGSWIVWAMNQEIRSGTLSQRLLRPIHPLVAYSAENLAALPLRAALCLPIAVGALFYVGRAGLPSTPTALTITALSLVGAWLINFLTMTIIGTLAFFLESSTAVFEVWMVAFMLLSGYLVPLELFPPTLRAVTNALPFRYTIAYPVELLVGMLEPARALHDLAVQWAYVAGCLGVTLLAWRAGLRRYAAFGG